MEVHDDHAEKTCQGASPQSSALCGKAGLTWLHLAGCLLPCKQCCIGRAPSARGCSQLHQKKRVVFARDIISRASKSWGSAMLMKGLVGSISRGRCRKSGAHTSSLL